MSKVVVAIPARYPSTRFPGKPLALLAGKPMIQHVFEKAKASKADKVIVATDDQRIVDAVEKLGGIAIMTDPEHPSGTDRIFEAIQNIDCDIVINVQGDEPLLPSSVIDDLIDLMQDNPDLEMATVAVPKKREELNSPNMVKVVFDKNGRAMYFSRASIPYLREGGVEVTLYWHWGVYAFRRDTLARFVKLDSGKFEDCEKLEQLRALENGIDIRVITSNLESIGVDTPEDLIRAEKYLKEQK